MGSTKSSFNWNGDQIHDKMQRAVNRAMVSFGEDVVSEAKQVVHRVTGTLSRSIHAAPPDYDGDGDLVSAKSGAVLQLDMGEDVVQWDGDMAFMEVGSWLPYAIIEETREGEHAYMQPGLEAAAPRMHDKMVAAMAEEGFNEVGDSSALDVQEPADDAPNPGTAGTQAEVDGDKGYYRRHPGGTK